MEPSPYLPVTRRFAHAVYLDLEPLIAVAQDTGQLDAADLAQLSGACRARPGRLPNTIDWSAAWRQAGGAGTSVGDPKRGGRRFRPVRP